VKSGVLGLLLALSSCAGISQVQAKSCDALPYHLLDFWVGDWDVVSPQGERQGSNRIEKILGGCAILEHWRDTQGGEGKSLFYYQPAGRIWKQVWVTDTAAVKEKTMLTSYSGRGLRFQGELPKKAGGTYLDRTTLVPLADGRVQQVIEISLDGGRTWARQHRWEGLYSRMK
jgi:hypothetical protein